jgi:hypothetical protein
MMKAYEELMKPGAFKFLEKGKGPLSEMSQKSLLGEMEPITRESRFILNPSGKTEAQEALERNLAKQRGQSDLTGGISFQEVINRYPSLGITNVMPMGWSGGGTTKQTPAQTSTSNILQQGHQYTLRDESGRPQTDKEGNIKKSSEVTMSQAAQDFQRVYGFKGSEDQVRKYVYGEYSEPR